MKRKTNETTKSKKRNDRLPLVGLFIVELLALLLIFIIGTRNARSDSIYRMRDIVNYIGDQCILYDHSSYEESVKSLIRISEKTQTFRWLSLYGFNTVDEDLIKLFAEDQRMTGIILTNDETGENLFYCEDGGTADDWMPIIKNGQINRIWTPELKSEIVYKHLDEHISVLTPERECAVSTEICSSKCL